MWLTTDTTKALVQARNEGVTLESVKAEKPKPPDADGKGVSTTLEALAAVIPTGIAATYTGVVLIVRGVALAMGTDDRAAREAGMAKAGKTADEIKRYLDGLPLESDKYFSLRVLLMVVALLAAVVLAWRAASDANTKAQKKRKFVVAEPVTAAVAFLGWALASPGTPIAAKYNADDTLVLTAVIAGVVALLLGAAGRVVLSKPANTEA